MKYKLKAKKGLVTGPDDPPGKFLSKEDAYWNTVNGTKENLGEDQKMWKQVYDRIYEERPMKTVYSESPYKIIKNKGEFKSHYPLETNEYGLIYDFSKKSYNKYMHPSTLKSVFGNYFTGKGLRRLGKSASNVLNVLVPGAEDMPIIPLANPDFNTNQWMQPRELKRGAYIYPYKKAQEGLNVDEPISKINPIYKWPTFRTKGGRMSSPSYLYSTETNQFTQPDKSQDNIIAKKYTQYNPEVMASQEYLDTYYPKTNYDKLKYGFDPSQLFGTNDASFAYYLEDKSPGKTKNSIINVATPEYWNRDILTHEGYHYIDDMLGNEPTKRLETTMKKNELKTDYDWPSSGEHGAAIRNYEKKIGYYPGDTLPTKIDRSQLDYSWLFKNISDKQIIGLIQRWDNPAYAPVSKMPTIPTPKSIPLKKVD